ncbi:MAG: nucleotide exchange factor GrpE [Isosphaeraceae bacterium]|jgi:molecular chaperone GrpE
MSGPGEIESVLARFHQWLAAARADAANSASSVLEQEAEHDSCRPFGLIDLVEEFTALRQELKLQTKSTRGLQEQAESLLPALRQAIEHFRSVAPREEQAAWSAGKPIAEGLATLDEALDRCRIEIEKARIVGIEQTPRKLAQALDRMHAGLPWLRRFLLRRYHRQMREVVEREAQGMNQAWLQSLLEGFDLIQNRVRKVLQSEAIEPITCLGRPVDPDRMIVIEITDSPDWPPQTVIEELRRGYTWRGRVLRLAEVRAVRGQRNEVHEEPDGEADPSLPHATAHEPSGDNGSRTAWLETE